MKKILLRSLVLFAALCAVSCNDKSAVKPAVLEGTIEGGFHELVVLTYKLGEMTEYLYPEAVDGKFDIVMNDVDEFVDMAVSVDDDVFGARIIPGDTLRIRVIPSEQEGHFDIEYEGPTERESRIWTDFYDVYGYWGQYNIRADRDPDVTYEDSMTRLGLKDLAFRTKYGDELDEYHVHRADLMGAFLKAVLMEYKASDEGVDAFDYPEYGKLLSDMDPNDPAVLSCGLLGRWARFRMRDMGDDDLSRCTAFMDWAQDRISYPESRKILASFIADLVLARPDALDDEKCDSFMNRIKVFSPDSEELVEAGRKAWEAYKSATSGSPMPDVVLTALNGSKVQLSSLFGKVLYIDFWATWCGPCLQETPYMAELVGRFKDNDGIRFISVSVDNTAKAWIEKVNADSQILTWPQYHLSEEQAEEFLPKLNINTIPRFVIVDSKGKIFAADAPRPSDERIDAALLSAMSL